MSVPYQAARAGGRILIVDDNRAVRAAVRLLLSGAGYAVAEAESGERAAEVAALSPPDLVLMDYSMPGMNGLEAAMRLRALDCCRSAPIVLLTGEEFAGGCDDPPSPYVDGYVNKAEAQGGALLDCVREHLCRESSK